MAEKVNGVAIPTSGEELGEIYHDPKKFAKIYENPDSADEFMNRYGRVMALRDPELQAQIRDQIQVGVHEMIQSDGSKKEPIGARLAGARPHLTYDGRPLTARDNKGQFYNKQAPGAQMEEKLKPEERFTSVGEYLQAIREEARPTTNRNRLSMLQKLANVREFQNSFGSEDPGSGGFLIPEILRSQLMELAIEEAIVRSRATVIPMNTLRVPVPTVDDTSHVSSIFGGVQFFWAEESAALPESQASFGRVVLDAKKLTGFFKVPNELLADAPAFSAWFDNRIPVGLAYFEDIAFMTETGAGTPEGFINSPAYIAVGPNAGARTTANKIQYPDVVAMWQQLLPQSQKNAVWICSHDTFAQIASLQLSTANASPGIWFGGYASNDATNTPPLQLFGRPIYFTEKVPKLGTLGDISLVDLSYYLVGDRQAMSVQSSEHFAFQNDQTAFRIIERVDGRPWLQTPLTPHNNSTATLSAYVGLHA